MASVIDDPRGRKRIQFTIGKGPRKTVRLGKASVKQAETFKGHVEQLVTASILGRTPDPDTADWLAKLDDVFYRRLAAVGLVRPRDTHNATLGAFIDGLIERQTTAKPQTVANMQQVRRWLVDCFGEGRDLNSIRPAEAEDFRHHMSKGGLGENTIRRHVGRCRQIFKAAIRRGAYRGTNPFDGMVATVGADKTREFFITREVAQKVIDACPDAQWRLLFALARYGGIRVPSEAMPLKWADVLWDKNRVRITSPKTAHHEGGDERYIPLFPELRPYLQDVYDAAEAGGSDFVITRYRDSNANLRTQLERIIRKAGVEPWGKPFQNLRSTRETELAERFPIQVVCKWIGNSERVARKHYLQVTDLHFDLAVKDLGQGEAQKAAHHTATHSTTEPQSAGAEAGNSQDLGAGEAVCVPVGGEDYPRQDSNKPHDSRGKPGASGGGGAKSGAFPVKTPLDLAELLAAWPRLDPRQRRQLLALVRSMVK